ncbi:MAG: hypothetical protein Ct9H90mP30_1220 [Actinomycetota bacterium]|nr:MAG: hypothetical protein Ct9H90mP30_1220 [Actinomycetota bacterium]
MYDPANVSPFVVWLCTDEAKDVNGQAFIVGGSGVWWMRSWSHINHIKLDAQKLSIARLMSLRMNYSMEKKQGFPLLQHPNSASTNTKFTRDFLIPLQPLQGCSCSQFYEILIFTI